jgi:hypothetical protein
MNYAVIGVDNVLVSAILESNCRMLKGENS